MGIGKIIYLNGVSGAGKTTLSKKLQQHLNEPFYLVSSDIFCSDMAPKRYWDGFEAVSLLLKTAKFYSEIGVNSIIDIVHIQDEEAVGKSDLFHEALKLLHDCPVLFVNVTCPTDELHRRKTERGDHDVDKWLKYQHDNFYPKETYDITVNTHNNTSEECADMIVKLLEAPEKLTTFKTHWERYSS